MPFIILSVLVQVALIVHIVKTGRNTTWLWIVLMLPGAGSIAYLIVEVLPDLMNGRSGRQVTRKVQSVVNPNRDINAASREYAKANTVENSMRLADEYLSQGVYDKAKTLYQKCLSGLYADDPELLYGLAQSQFGLDEFAGVVQTLDELKTKNPGYRNADAHLIYARSLAGLERVDEAQHEFTALHSYFPGPAASFYYGLFLKSQGKVDEANDIFRQIQATAKIADKHYRVYHADILKRVKAEMSK